MSSDAAGYDEPRKHLRLPITNEICSKHAHDAQSHATPLGRRNRRKPKLAHRLDVVSNAVVKIESGLESQVGPGAGIVHDAAIAGAEAVVIEPSANFDLSVWHDFSHCVSEIMQRGPDSAGNVVGIVGRSGMQNRQNDCLGNIIDIDDIVSLVAATRYFDRPAGQRALD